MIRSFTVLLVSLCAALVLFLPDTCFGRNWDTSARFMLAAEPGSRAVAIIDVDELKVAGEIQTQWPLDEIAVSRFGNKAYAGHVTQKKISVIDLAVGAVSHVLDVPMAPRHMTVDTRSGVLMTDSENGGMALVDLSGESVRFYNASVPPAADAIFGATGTVAFYHGETAGEIGAVAMEDGRSLWRIKTPEGGAQVPLVRSLDGLFVVVVFAERGEIAALDSSSGRPLVLHQLGRGLARPYVSANGRYFLVPDPENSQLHLLSQSNFALVRSLKLDEGTPIAVAGIFDTMGLAVGPTKSFLFDLNARGEAVLQKTTMPGLATDALVTSDGKRAFFAVPDQKTITSINMLTRQTARISLSHSATILAMGSTDTVCH